MRALVVGMVLLAACQGCTRKPVVEGPVGRQQQYRWAVDEMLRRTVHIQKTCLDGRGPREGGSGVHLGGGYIVTAEHVVKDPLCVYTADRVLATKLRVDAAHDIALLVTGGHVGDDVRMRDGYMGEELRVVGYAMQHSRGNPARLTITDGILAVKSLAQNLDRVTAAVYFGNSGGGVWSLDGTLLGVAIAVYAQPQTFGGLPVPYESNGLVIPARYVRALLENH